MKPLTITNGQRAIGRSASFCKYLLVASLVFLWGGCSELEKPASEPYFAETPPPRKQEFRWSNGKMPGSFDPARAAAPPETDIVRAIFEGLTETDPVNLGAVPGVAASWAGSEDYTVWTFELRRNAKWSNGDSVTAADFVRSWKRLAGMGDGAAHHELLENIVGAHEIRARVMQEALEKQAAEAGRASDHDAASKPADGPKQTDADRVPSADLLKSAEGGKDSISPPPPLKRPASKDEIKSEPELGVEAIDEFVLRVTLVKPDREFPMLAAHPTFRPVHVEERGFDGGGLNSGVLTNGAFRILSVGQDGVTLDRSATYWNWEKVALERVRFVPAESAEKALEAYRAGEVDAVTNAEFKPLALKLLTPYDDFRRTVHSAVNLYQFNRNNKPFDDRRVREALAISIARERLTDDEMDGATKPALSFSPFDKEGKTEIKQDPEQARELLAEAGYPGGANFPKVRLLIKRNNIQQRIARSIADMWKRNLGIDALVTAADAEEFDAAVKSGQYDLVRQGVVLATGDETANMMTIFSHDHGQPREDFGIGGIEGLELIAPSGDKMIQDGSSTDEAGTESTLSRIPSAGSGRPEEDGPAASEDSILTEAEALKELRAIPLYFPTTYSLVKPYVVGFSINTLDAPSLQNVRIDNNWQPRKIGG